MKDGQDEKHQKTSPIPLLRVMANKFMTIGMLRELEIFALRSLLGSSSYQFMGMTNAAPGNFTVLDCSYGAPVQHSKMIATVMLRSCLDIFP